MGALLTGGGPYAPAMHAAGTEENMPSSVPEQRSSWPRRLAWWSAALLVLGVIVLAIVRGVQGGSRPTATLANGHILTLEAVLSGPSQIYRTRPKLICALRDVLPFRMRSLLGPAPTEVRSGATTNEVTFFFTQHDPVTGTYVTPEVGVLALLDEQGQVFHVQASHTVNSGVGKGNVRFMRVEWFPRRARQFRLRVSLPSPAPPVEWVLPNPWAGRQYTVWTPQPLPRAITTNGLEITLERLRARGWGTNEYAFDPVLRIRERGVDITDTWTPEVTFRDATGNQHRRALSLLEPAWKVDLNLFRTAKAPFRDDEVRPLGRVPLPQPGEVRIIEVPEKLREMGMSFAALAGPGQYTFKDGQVTTAQPWKPGMGGSDSSSQGSGSWSWNQGGEHTKLLVKLGGTPREDSLVFPMGANDRRLLVRARDDQGRLAESGNAGSHGSSDGKTAEWLRDWDLKIPEGASELELGLIPLRALAIEFIVPPPDQKDLVPPLRSDRL